jgi:hypothetical protein
MNKALSPAVFVVIIVAVVAGLGFVGWKMMGPKAYSGPPINMGEKMKMQTGGRPPTMGDRMKGMQSGGPGR